jgi:hypothetical protein
LYKPSGIDASYERIAILHWFWLGRFTYWWAGIWRLQSKYLDLYER